MLSMFTSSPRSARATWCTSPGWSSARPVSRYGSRGAAVTSAAAGVSRAGIDVASLSASRSAAMRSIASWPPLISITIANWPCRFAMRLSSTLPPRAKTNSETSSTRPGLSSPIAVNTVRPVMTQS